MTILGFIEEGFDLKIGDDRGNGHLDCGLSKNRSARVLKLR